MLACQLQHHWTLTIITASCLSDWYIVELCAILQAKQDVAEEQKEDIVRDVTDICQKSLLSPDDNRPLKFIVSR